MNDPQQSVSAAQNFEPAVFFENAPWRYFKVRLPAMLDVTLLTIHAVTHLARLFLSKESKRA